MEPTMQTVAQEGNVREIGDNFLLALVLGLVVVAAIIAATFGVVFASCP
jgi:hypothetical protein